MRHGRKILLIKEEMVVSTKNRFQKAVWAFLKDESGQSTTEYVLLLLFVVLAVRAVGGGLKEKLTGIMNAAFQKTTDAVNESQ